GVPAADGLGVGDLRGVYGAAEHRQVGGDGAPGNAAHDVDAELETQAVNVVGEQTESGAVRGGGKTVGSRQQPPVRVHDEFGVRTVAVGLGMRLRPLNVDHHVLPAVFFQVGGHIPGVGFDFGLGDG